MREEEWLFPCLVTTTTTNFRSLARLPPLLSDLSMMELHQVVWSLFKLTFASGHPLHGSSPDNLPCFGDILGPPHHDAKSIPGDYIFPPVPTMLAPLFIPFFLEFLYLLALPLSVSAL
jgi:hypothetical protein